MAIVKMKHLRLVAMGSDREDLLQILQRMGCVEIDAPSVASEMVSAVSMSSGSGSSAAYETASPFAALSAESSLPSAVRERTAPSKVCSSFSAFSSAEAAFSP